MAAPPGFESESGAVSNYPPSQVNPVPGTRHPAPGDGYLRLIPGHKVFRLKMA
ncbi:GD12167 [Drosophila simulans]|uniref:GD12167 n=1 Tax=Drosophila simulans TaxID=7240 RepID=B4QJ61_DROSI|nr:GD12167 [Drosophila simulans]